jgi:hypothetical protein
MKDVSIEKVNWVISVESSQVCVLKVDRVLVFVEKVRGLLETSCVHDPCFQSLNKIIMLNCKRYAIPRICLSRITQVTETWCKSNLWIVRLLNKIWSYWIEITMQITLFNGTVSLETPIGTQIEQNAKTSWHRVLIIQKMTGDRCYNWIIKQLF